MDIKRGEGYVLQSIPITADAVKTEELMKQDSITLSWRSVTNDTIPLGAYIEHNGDRYTLLAPYSPSQVSEVEYEYKPVFHSRIMRWQSIPFFHYNKVDGSVVSKEPDWTLTDNPANFMSVICDAIKNETGEEWTYAIADNLPASTSLSFSNVDIFSALNSIANAFDTEWWVDKENNVLHLSKASFGEPAILEVGSNINIPSITNSKNGYFTRFYAFGSTRNIEQDYEGANVNNQTNRRLTLDPIKYPNGYKDIRENLADDEVLSKVLFFDNVYPKSDLVISDVRARLMWRLDDNSNKVQVGTDDDGNPIYDQYAIWYFKIPDYTFDESSIIAGKALSVKFKSGALSGREFELTYHSEEKRVSTSDGTDFIVSEGDYEINFIEDGSYIIPAITGLIPSDGNEITLFNIVMPEEYKQSAYNELEQELDKEIARIQSDLNNYSFDSNKVAFYENNPNLSIGRSVTYKNGSYSYSTRVIKLETKIDYPFEQKITIGNEQIKGNTQELKEEVVNANQNIDLLASINEMTNSITQAYQRTQKAILESLSKYSDMLGVDADGNVYVKKLTDGTPRNFYSFGEITAGGVGEGGSSSSGAAYNRLDTWENYNASAGDVLSATLGYGLKTEIENIQNTIADGVLSSVIVKLGSTEYKAVNGVVSLPAYPIMPDVPTLVSELQNDAGYITNAALGGYATQSWVQQQKYLTSIPSEYITATGLSSTLVNYQSKITSSNKLDYSLLENTPTIPSAVTESTVSGWGFTKNAGTVTEVKMNGASKTPTNGVIDLGSVITAHQDLSNYATLSDIEPLDERLTIIESTYLDSITQQMVIDALDYTPFDSASFTKANIKSALGIADWALASSKPSYSWDEITSRPTLLSQFTDDIVAGKYLPLTGGVLSGALSVPNINITSAAAVAHLAFGRQGGNFITAPSGGYFTFIPTGKGIATANADLVITDGHVYPGTTGYTRLGFGDKRWSQVSSVDGDFSGALTAGTFSTANVVSCGGRLRINASNSVNSFGFLKATAYTTSLNRAVLNIGSNYGGSGNIASEAVDVVAMSIYRGAVGIGRAFTYDELYANRASNVMLSVAGNINNVGDIVSTGEQVAGSDMRYKIVKSKFRLSSAIIAHAPLFRFKWKNHKTTKLKIGTSAQYWEEFAPELVTFDSVSDFKHLNYAGLGVAIGISNAREIEQLKKEIVSLKERLSKYEHN